MESDYTAFYEDDNNVEEETSGAAISARAHNCEGCENCREFSSSSSSRPSFISRRLAIFSEKEKNRCRD
jgi:hypothetical protein